ncbi:Anti-sigma-I factor RsgI1 [Dissostichus eleginoides]|uniref:Anti-sigma-I factor RsgI1 n=1 Tax=Dissostichus eleginoides TaxID=100907 RepID=A0AAD9EY29_DISEL|nr:Anti-sigma-I factor RsgI1 [Dissostichus eleginoides]
MLSREKSFTRQVQHLTEKLSSVLTMTGTETRTLPASVPGPPSLLSTQPNTLAPPIHPHSQLPTASSAHPSFPLLSLKNKTQQVVLRLTQMGSSWTQESFS